MSLNRYAKKRDVAEKEIVSVLRDCGFSVMRLDQPVDLLVGVPGRKGGPRRTYLVECKSGFKGYGKELNANQTRFADEWRGSPVVVLHSAQCALDWAVEVLGEAA